ncbi:HNH endonuclease [Rhodovulum strictum]|uniref:HNH endonuclease n=1 Tax=Rhodovulum strictum TaxID=58314 RepID=UPI001FECDFD4|nr:HNH endonuclease [Rhodovulum strictum]
MRQDGPRRSLTASHIIPWKDCTTDAERLDVHNGLLLSALWDAAFVSEGFSPSEQCLRRCAPAGLWRDRLQFKLQL